MDLLYFQLDRGPYAIPLDAIADVAPAGRIHPVPLAPPAVKGLAERRGRPIAVIDLPRLLDDTYPDAAPETHLVRLAAPWDGTAFWVPASVFSGAGAPAGGTDGGGSGHVFIDGRLHLLLDAGTLVKRAAAYA